MVLSEATHIDINRKKHKPDIAMLTVLLIVDETNHRGKETDLTSPCCLLEPACIDSRRDGD